MEGTGDGRSGGPRGGVTASVVVPVKDDAAELRRCLDALAAQTRPPDEVVVVDNGSSDPSATVAAAAGARVVRCDDPGIAAAASFGYDCAAGAFILRLDADCVPDPAWVAQVLGAFARDDAVVAVTGDARFVDGPAWLRAPLAAVYLGAYRAVAATALGHRTVFGSNLALRRDVWRDIRSEVHRHDPAIHDDFDLAFHVGERGRIGLLRGAPMGISMRPFASAPAFARRIGRGVRTVVIHWPRDFPPLRWRRLARGIRRHGTVSNRTSTGVLG